MDGTIERWLRATVPLIQQQQAQSARLAAEYMRAFRAMELGIGDTFVARAVVEEAVEAIVTSLTVTGPVTIKEQTKRLATLEHAATLAESRSSAAAMRHVLNAGRNTILINVAEDRRALGYARKTSGDTCSFCAMLASRGPVYKDDSFEASNRRFVGQGEAKVHDNCYCGFEPLYHRDAAWPPGSRRYQELWNEAKSLDGDTTKNFRRLIEGRIPA